MPACRLKKSIRQGVWLSPLILRFSVSRALGLALQTVDLGHHNDGPEGDGGYLARVRALGTAPTGKCCAVVCASKCFSFWPRLKELLDALTDCQR